MDANFKTSEFMCALVKNLQVLCHGYVPFANNIEVIGHLYLKVDSSTKLNYFLNEIVSKNDSSGTLFTSNSFQAEPKPENLTPLTIIDPSSRLTNKIKVVMDSSSNVTTETSPVFLPKIINIQSFAADTSVPIIVSKECGQQTPVQMPNVSFTELSPLSANSVSDVVKNIKKEPCDPSEELIASPVVASPNRSSKQKRKSSHTTKVDYSSIKTEQMEVTPKKPRIIQSRKLLPKREPDVQNDSSQSSTGDVDDVPVHFDDGDVQKGGNDSNVFPVSLLKNLSTMDEAGTSSQSVVWLNAEKEAIDDSALKKALQTFIPSKRRGTYNFYSQEEKKKAIELAAQFGIAPICQKFGIPSSTLWTWRKTFEKYRAELAVAATIKLEKDSSSS